ncbi:MAG: hypothetical protein ICV68_16705, partial [Pyrinomonadaceae bacterium]|nr:hypothetical protein [Pyrinomonadaceae bacterium]
AEHLPTHLLKAKDAEEVARADDLLEQVRYLQGHALDILERAENAGDLRTALAAISQARGNLELLGKLAGELTDSPQVNILILPEWTRIRTALLEALAPYPEARAPVAERLLELEAGQ